MSRSPRQIGTVRHVLGATVTVELSSDLAGVDPTWEGVVYRIGQVGSLVLIPQGTVTLIGIVSLLGISDISPALPLTPVPAQGDRWLRVELVGQTDALGGFQRGVSSFPGLDDPVLFATSEDLRRIYPPAGPDRLRVGVLSSAASVPLTLDPRAIVIRHCAIVGSTGSGKTSAVASLLQSLANGWPSANIIVIDPHGEYASALGDRAAVRSVTATEHQLEVPYWALPADQVLRVFAGAIESATVRNRFSDLVRDGRRAFAAGANWVETPQANIGADTPIPFDLHQVWYQLDFENRATYGLAGGQGDVQTEEDGDAGELRPARFAPYGLGSAAPFKGPAHGLYQQVPERIRHRLTDEGFRFLLSDMEAAAQADPLRRVLNEWVGGGSPVSVLDFSGVPGDAADVAIGLVLQLIFEVATRGEGDGFGRARPVLIVLEEAHRYLGDEGKASGLANAITARIAREGRKHGVGLWLVTQRPSELPSTALSQVGTVIALRLTNGGDQSVVRDALPDTDAGLASALASLRTGEAVISGEATVLPTRVEITPPNPWPKASDPELASWKATPSEENDLTEPVRRWRNA